MSQLPSARPPAIPLPLEPNTALLYTDHLNDLDSESAIRRYWRIFFKRRHLILAIIGLCLGLAIVVSLMAQPQYTATVRIQVAREAAKVVDMEQVEEETAGGPGVEFYQTQYALLKSRSLAEEVVRDLNLINDPVFAPQFGRSSEGVAQLKANDREKLATDVVNDNTIITPVRGSSIIDVEYEATDPALAARIANSLAENFIETNLRRRYEAAAYARQFLQSRLNDVRIKLEESERKAIQYAQQQGLIKIRAGSSENPTEQSLIANDLAGLSSQLTIARAQRAQAEAQYRAGASGTMAAQSLTSSTVNELRRQRADLLGQLSKLQSDFGPEYPPIVALRSQIDQLDRQIDNEQSRVNASVAQDLGGRYRQALAAERSIQARVDSLKSQLLGEQGRSIQFNILQRDVDTNRALYDALLQRFKEVGIAGGVGTNNVSIVDRALPPESPSSPNLPLNLALGLLIGLLIGGAAAVVIEQLSESVILPAEFQSKLRVPLLGTTPTTNAPLLQKLLTGGASGTNEVSTDLVDGQSELAEAYFSILTAVQFSTPNGAPRTIAVTSSQAREGKSTTAIALARGLASLGTRILLIDADMRKPSLHTALGLQRRKGLSNVLTGHESLHEVTLDTKIRGVSVITAGEIPPNPAELLASDKLGLTLKSALDMFDHVIIDTPPVLGLADAPLIARIAEGTVFVIEAGRTRSSQARHALDRLLALRAHILGAVLTKLDSRNSGYGEGYGYTYRYGPAVT